jgi:hypothetical protein
LNEKVKSLMIATELLIDLANKAEVGPMIRIENKQLYVHEETHLSDISFAAVNVVAEPVTKSEVTCRNIASIGLCLACRAAACPLRWLGRDVRHPLSVGGSW